MKVKCKQCNNVFEYERYDGICNKCCHYYGKFGMENDELIKNQQYKVNNTYEINADPQYTSKDTGKNVEKEYKNEQESKDNKRIARSVTVIFIIVIMVVRAYLKRYS